MKLFRRKSSRLREGNHTRPRRAKSWRDLMEVDYDDRSPLDRQRVRRERFWRGFKWVAVLALIGGAIHGGRLLFNHHVLENPTYQLAELLVETDGYLPQSHIVREAQLPDDANLLLLRLGAIKERIEQLPQVHTASVERELPGVLRITVSEYRPVAWLECESEIQNIVPFSSENGYLIDAEGHPFACRAVLRSFMRLPVLKVRDLASVKSGVRLTSPEVLSALELIALNEEILFKEQIEIKTVEPMGPYALLATYRNDAEVLFGTDDVGEQLKDFSGVLKFAASHGLQIQTLDLMVKENHPVTFFNDPERLPSPEPLPESSLTGPPSSTSGDGRPDPVDPAPQPRAGGIVAGETSPAGFSPGDSSDASTPASAPVVPAPEFPIKPPASADVSEILGSLY